MREKFNGFYIQKEPKSVKFYRQPEGGMSLGVIFAEPKIEFHVFSGSILDKKEMVKDLKLRKAMWTLICSGFTF